MRHVVGHRGEERVAVLERQAALDHLAVERDLDVDLIVRAIDAGRIVDEVGVDAAALRGEGDARRLGDAQVRALADCLAAQLLGIDAQAIVGGIADLAVTFGRGLDIGADAAEPEQPDPGPEDRRDQRGRVDLLHVEAEQGLDLRAERDRFLGAREHAAALGDQRGIIVRPAGARQREHAGALVPTLRRIGIGIEEDVAMVEGGDQLDRLRQQHAVAEHVARHVAAARHGDRLGLDVGAHLQEVAADRDPGALGGDAHRLVVIAVRAAGGEGVAQPEVALGRDRIGDV